METQRSRWSLWRKRKRKVEEHIQFVSSSEQVDLNLDDGNIDLDLDQSCSTRTSSTRSSRRSSTRISRSRSRSSTRSSDEVEDQSFQLHMATATPSNTCPDSDSVSDTDHPCQVSLALQSATNTFEDSDENCRPLSPTGESGDNIANGNMSDLGTVADVSSDETDTDDLSDGYYSPIASDEETLSGDNDDTNEQLTDNLADWAAQSQIPHSKLKGLLSVLRQYHPHLPKDPRTLLQTTTAYNISAIGGGEYYHFGLACVINKLPQLVQVDRDISRISFQVNIDGLPLYKSSKKQFWPILGRVVSPFESETFIIGLYSGVSKPSDVEQYLEQFVLEVKELEVNGILIETLNKIVPISVACFICDAPARAFIKQTKPHNAYYGCEKCIQKGVWAGKVTFPQTDSPLRTDSDVKQMVQEEHHYNPTPISQLSIGLVSQFPLDPMHLVHLGVVKRLIWSWIKGPIANRCRLSSNICQQISASLISCHPYVPREFPRKCRSFDEFERWKATEFRQFILYSGAVVLKGKLQDSVYSHFLLFNVAIFCLSSSLFLSTHCDYAGELLKLFVRDWANLYGKDMLVYNVHGLVHLAADAKQFGPLDSFSAFPFESFLGRLKKIVRKPHRCLPQVIRRLSEMRTGGQKGVKEDLSIGAEHAEGPVLILYRTFSQHRSMQLNGFYFSVNDGDNCVLIGSDYGLIRNITRDPQDLTVLLMFEPFMVVEDFFKRPLKSSDLGIVKVSRLSDTIRAEKVSDLVCKLYRIPYKESFVLVPLVHQLC